MKLLILLFALLVQTNPSLSRPTKKKIFFIFNEVKSDLQKIQQKLDGFKPEDLKQHLAVFNHPVKIQTPRNIENACECEALYVQHLKEFMRLLDQIFSWDQFRNISENLDKNLRDMNPSGNCKFPTHNITDASLKDLIQDNIDFIENWNTNCKKSRKSN